MCCPQTHRGRCRREPVDRTVSFDSPDTSQPRRNPRRRRQCVAAVGCSEVWEKMWGRSPRSSGPDAFPGRPDKSSSQCGVSLHAQVHCSGVLTGLQIDVCLYSTPIKLHAEKRAARKKMQAARGRIYQS